MAHLQTLKSRNSVCQKRPDFLLKKLMVHIQVIAVRFLVLQQVETQECTGRSWKISK